MNEERIYVSESGLRSISHDGKLPPGCWWEDEQDYDDEPDYSEPLLAQLNKRDDLEEVKQQLAQLLAVQQGPSRARLAAQRVVPLFHRLFQGAPCITVWIGMVATFFWQAYHGVDEQTLASFVDLPDEVPLRIVAATLQTSVFLLWTVCFRRTIGDAIRKEFDATRQ